MASVEGPLINLGFLAPRGESIECLPEDSLLVGHFDRHELDYFLALKLQSLATQAELHVGQILICILSPLSDDAAQPDRQELLSYLCAS